jgi:(1->4)-alpha-D-glucan 1-alpha-D-glucosylmutase
MMPGVPDLYQGTELWDLSLVDPDNRRRVDFAARSAALGATGERPDWAKLTSAWPDGRIKLALTHALLSLRQRVPALFTGGDYRAIEVTGPHRNEIIAFARARGRDAVIVAVGRLFARAADGGRRWPSGVAWDASLSISGFSPVRTIFGNRAAADTARWRITDLFETIPVAVIEATTPRFAALQSMRQVAGG